MNKSDFLLRWTKPSSSEQTWLESVTASENATRLLDMINWVDSSESLDDSFLEEYKLKFEEIIREWLLSEEIMDTYNEICTLFKEKKLRKFQTISMLDSAMESFLRRIASTKKRAKMEEEAMENFKKQFWIT